MSIIPGGVWSTQPWQDGQRATGPINNNVYLDLNEVYAPAGSVIVSWGFYQIQNRYAIHAMCQDIYGRQTALTTTHVWGAPDDKFIQFTDDLYCDSNPALCPSGMVVCGLGLYQHANRFAMKLQFRYPSEPSPAPDADWVFGAVDNANYFQGENGVINMWQNIDWSPLVGGTTLMGAKMVQVNNQIKPSSLLVPTKPPTSE